MREERPICGIAFDLDGTLTDSAPGLTAALDRTLSEQSLPTVDLACIATWIDNGADVLVERAAAQRATRLRFDEHYAGTVVAGSTLFSEVADTLGAAGASVASDGGGDQQAHALRRAATSLARYRAPFRADYQRR